MDSFSFFAGEKESYSPVPKRTGPLAPNFGRTAEQAFSDEEEDVFLLVLMVCWYTISQKSPEMRMITAGEWKQIAEKNRQELKKWGRLKKTTRVSTAYRLLNEVEQPYLFGFTLEKILQSGNVREEMKWFMLLEVKTVLECLQWAVSC